MTQRDHTRFNYDRHQTGRPRQALDFCQRILAVDPANAEALHLMGILHHESGKNIEAINYISQASRFDPTNPMYINNLGVVYRDMNQFDDAIRCYRKAILLKPDYDEAYSNLGAALRLAGFPEDAVSSCQKAIKLNPKKPEPYFNLALAYQAHGFLNKAIAIYSKLLAISPNNASAVHNQGVALMGLGRIDEAVNCYRYAIRINPQYTAAYNSLSVGLRIQGDFEAAIRACETVLRVNPDNPDAVGNLAILYKHTCNWHDLNRVKKRLHTYSDIAINSKAKPVEQPLFNVWTTDDPCANQRVAKAWSNDIVERMQRLNLKFFFNSRRPTDSRITVGYLSGDFRDHPVAHQVQNLFKHHDRREFRVYCYSYGFNDRSIYRNQLEHNCDRFIDIAGISHADAARRVHADEVDILIDLNGHTAGNRLEICALRPAPVQVSFLGFPGTTGADFFDYLITDHIVVPKPHMRWYSEKLVFMPHCYHIADNRQPISPKKFKKEDIGLSENHFIFSSFNKLFKIDPEMFDIWLRILHRVPNSVLWLSGGHPMAVNNLKCRAEKRGVPVERIIFAEKLPSKSEYLARIQLADLALDTRLYNGHSSTLDTLWAGVPVLTLKGRHFASRVSASMLEAVDLKELIKETVLDYENEAVRLAVDPDRLNHFRKTLQKNRANKPLFDTARFTRNLETAFRQMLAGYQLNRKPEHIHLTEENQ